MANKPPDLLFGPGSNSGFTPAGIAAFDNLRPAAVVRELIQNALDAAQACDAKPAVVRFRLEEIKTSQIPGIKSYEKAFNAAVKTQKEMGAETLPTRAQYVVSTIQKALNQDTQNVLSVLDNGIGLNEQRMTALLSDGVSVKDGNATGTYGNGHSVAIPASDLRYVLYGGITANKESIGSGHAVIASHSKRNLRHLCAGDGFLVLDFANGAQGKLYKYAKKSCIPKLIADNLEKIRKYSDHGTAVVIPAFNNLREEDKTLWEMVAQAAACNFFEAIKEKRLEVHVEDLRNKKVFSKTIDYSTVLDTLKTYRENRRSRDFLSGQKAFEAYNVLCSGTSHMVPTSQGNIRIYFDKRSSGNTRIDLCRNGMWITYDKHINQFRYQFKNNSPFHAVLLLDSIDSGGLHRLVRDAEGPLHNNINLKNLSVEDNKNLRKAFKEIRDWLQNHAPQINDESYSPDDFLALDFGDGEKGQRGKAKNSFWGIPAVIGQRTSSRIPFSPTDTNGKTEPEKNGGKRKNEKRRKNLSRRKRPTIKPFFQAVSIPAGSNRRRIQIECQEDCENAEFRLRIDENVDATCEQRWYDQKGLAHLSKVKINGQRAEEKSLVQRDGQVIGVRLGGLSSGIPIQIETDYKFPEDFESLPKTEPSLRIEVFKSPSDTLSEDSK